ncbi:hypothetical protein [Devosia nitrariae]|uniref:Uncharacterized protein n=1 Tax=Devosia nitrariae TaxID=2071872 RepID=A0ABQ5W161_9HYPH|nr:hypothetical protein [Devosia nitrariae]GLQ53614.1 hypothetical protein GCM10010862_08730 [Devosia nitrariae]
MRTILAAIGAALRAVAAFTWVVCKRTGRLVLQLVPDFGASAPAPTPVSSPSRYAPPAGETGGLIERIKAMATAMAMGEDIPAEAFQAVPEQTAAWLMAMDRTMLCRVISARDADLKDHLRGNGSIRGVIACDPRSIADYVEAMERDARPPEPERPAPRRTLAYA